MHPNGKRSNVGLPILRPSPSSAWRNRSCGKCQSSDIRAKWLHWFFQNGPTHHWKVLQPKEPNQPPSHNKLIPWITSTAQFSYTYYYITGMKTKCCKSTLSIIILFHHYDIFPEGNKMLLLMIKPWKSVWTFSLKKSQLYIAASSQRIHKMDIQEATPLAIFW